MFNGKRVIEFIIKGKDNTGPAFSGIGGKIKGLATSAAGIGAAFLAVGAAAVKMAAVVRRAWADAAVAAGQYQKAIFEVNTLMNADSKAVTKLGNDLQALAVKFGQVDTVMARAQYNVVSAGFGDVADSMHILEVSSKAAIAGISDVNTAARVITQTLNAYGKSAEDAEAVAGTLFATVKGGVTTFEELAGYLGKVTASAAVAGISFEEVSAAMAVMTKNGINTAEAATALNSLIIALGAATGESKDKLNELGINLDRGLAPALAAINESGGDSLMTLREMVPNIRALKAASSAGANGAKQLKEQLVLMTDGVNNFNDAYAIMAETLDMANRRLDAAQKRLKVAVGATVIEGQTDAITSHAEALNTLAESMEKNSARTKELFGNVGELTGAFIGAVTAADKFLVPLVDAAIASTKLAQSIHGVRNGLALLGVDFDDAAESANTYYQAVTPPPGQLGPVTVPMVNLKSNGLGPFVRSAEEVAAAAGEAALATFAASWGVGTTKVVFDAKTMKWVDVPKTAAEIADAITEAYGTAVNNVVDTAPTLPKEMFAPGDAAEPDQLLLLEDIMAAEKERAEQLTQYYGNADIHKLNGMLSPEEIEALDERWADFLEAQERAKEQQRELSAAVRDVAQNFERLSSNSISAFLKGEAGALRFGTLLRTVVIDALSAVIAKLLVIQALSFFKDMAGGLKHGGTIPEFAAGGTIPRAAVGYAVPDGPRGRDSRLIAAMPGEEVIRRSLSQRLDQFLTSNESAAIVSPFGLGGGGGGNTTVNLQVARPMSYLDALDLGEHAATAARKVSEANLT